MQPHCVEFWLVTTAGNHLKAIQAIFSYISLLKISISSLPRYFEEFRELSEMFFRKREKSQPHTYVISLTARLEEGSPAQRLLNADSLYREYSERAVKDVLDCLLPEKARLTLSAKNHEASAERNQIIWRKEKWYGTEYAIQEFGPEVLEKVCLHILVIIAHKFTQIVSR